MCSCTSCNYNSLKAPPPPHTHTHMWTLQITIISYHSASAPTDHRCPHVSTKGFQRHSYNRLKLWWSIPHVLNTKMHFHLWLSRMHIVDGIRFNKWLSWYRKESVIFFISAEFSSLQPAAQNCISFYTVQGHEKNIFSFRECNNHLIKEVQNTKLKV